MNILVLFVSSGMALILLIIHSYFLRGRRITLNFFVFAFILAFLKEGAVRKEMIYELYPYLKLYGFSNEVPVFLASLIATIGWIFTFYISWSIAEMIIERLHPFRNRVFATLLMSSLVIMGISYCIEVTAMNIEWWHWDVNPLTNKDLFVGGYSFMPMGAWIFFCLSFLTTFFLIECSKYRESYWKSIFLFIPFVYGWSVYYYGPRVSVLPIGTMKVLGIFILLLSFLAIFNQLRLEYGYIDYDNRNTNNLFSIILLRNIPVFVLLFMASIVITADLFIINNPLLLISMVPLIFLLGLSIKKVPLQFIALAALIIVLLDKLRLRTLFTVMPVIFFFILWVFSRSKERILLRNKIVR